MNDDVENVDVDNVQADSLNDQQVEELEALQPDFEPKDGQQENQGTIDSNVEAMVATVLGIGFSIVAVRAGDHWKLAPQELEILSKATVPVINKYVPDLEASPEVALVIAAGMVVVPRLMVSISQSEDEEDGDKSESEPTE